MRSLKYHVATTADGFIARKDGSFDCFPTTGDHIADYLEALKSYDTVLMGRKTYDVGLKVDVTDPYPHMMSYVFSRTMKSTPNPRVELITDDVARFVEQLKAAPGGDIYLCGGGELATQLLNARLIDEVILKVNPLLLGSGIPLFNGMERHIDLQLTDTKTYSSGVVLLTYRVKY